MKRFALLLCAVTALAYPAQAEEPLMRLNPLPLDEQFAQSSPRMALTLKRDESDFLPYNRQEALTLGAKYHLSERFSVEAEITRPSDNLSDLIENGFGTDEKERGSSYSFNPFQSERILRFRYKF